MRWLTCVALLASFSVDLAAHHPDRENQRVWPRLDLIPPLGVNLSPSYVRRYNRPTRRTGRVLYHIAPSSREGMTWHDASHQQAYRMDRGRLEKHFFYAKPWEGLKLGPRAETVQTAETLKPITSDHLREALRAEDRQLVKPRP